MPVAALPGAAPPAPGEQQPSVTEGVDSLAGEANEAARWVGRPPHPITLSSCVCVLSQIKIPPTAGGIVLFSQLQLLCLALGRSKFGAVTPDPPLCSSVSELLWSSAFADVDVMTDSHAPS